MKKWLKPTLFLIGFLLCVYPLISNVIEQRRQNDAVATYKKAVEGTKKDDLTEIWNQAQEYNKLLYQSQGAVVDDVDLLSDEEYNSQLNASDIGVMGSLDIPKINVNLPIYHGTGDEALANGVGHLQGTSLPVGGENSHCVLSGHRGLPSSKLLVRLDEMEEGDYFYLRVCGETLAYEVTEITVVEPGDVSSLEIQPEQDMVSLVTCTPYGLNTHRLIVTGIRVDYEKTEYETIQESVPSVRELLLTALPFVFLGVILFITIYDRRERYDDGKI